MSESGKVSLIDFGLSDTSNNEGHKKHDFDSLDLILGGCNTNENNHNTTQYHPESKKVLDYIDKENNDGNESNSSSDEIFDISA